MMSFEWPWQYSFPPFFTLQPNVDTRQKQLTAWCSLVLSYCRLNKLYTMTVPEAQESPLFNNWKLQRKLSLESILVVLEELRKKGNLEWLDKNKSSFLILWRCPEEWGKLIYQWVLKNGLTNSVFTLYELSNGEDTEEEDDTKLAGIANTPEDRLKIQKDLDRLEDWALSNKMKFNSEKKSQNLLTRSNCLGLVLEEGIIYLTNKASM
ncbi:vacuolar protein-sorting-associated protein 25 isoform X2 [Ahaetulla prasina]|uniref:vacuolar protein-sorting-associated protein 25 isoform X2 n=1 Tax=Ahaetulla prasina TaxID=499056 RepID=UPI0026470B77|nr:vacuolar protein-sorting-associated protein 25 isoform X2 [Ahaetulla prasina]